MKPAFVDSFSPHLLLSSRSSQYLNAFIRSFFSLSSVYLVLWIGLIHFLCRAVKAHFAPYSSVGSDAVFILFSQHFIEIKKDLDILRFPFVLS